MKSWSSHLFPLEFSPSFWWISEALKSSQVFRRCSPDRKYVVPRVPRCPWVISAGKASGHFEPVRHPDTYMAMNQYLLIPFLEGWTSIYQLFWCSPGVQGFDTLPHHWCHCLRFRDWEMNRLELPRPRIVCGRQLVKFEVFRQEPWVLCILLDLTTS